MNDRNGENLKDLFEKFIGGEQAEEAVEDIRKGEQILHEHPAPGPGSELIANIKAEIAAGLLRKKEKAFRKIIYKTVAVAAGFIILAAIGLEILEKDKAGPERTVTDSVISNAVWDSNRLADDNASLATMIAEIEQIESDLRAIQLDETSGDNYEALTELEMELIEISSDFWKG